MKIFLKVLEIIGIIIISLILMKFVNIIIGVSFFIILTGFLIYYLLIKNTYIKENMDVEIKSLLNNLDFNYKHKVAIVTLETRKMKELLSIHNNSFMNYANYHGYKYIFFDKYESVKNLPIYWQKLEILLDILKDKNNDYVMWVDSDTLVAHPRVSLNIILNQSDSSIFIGKDEPYKDNNAFCAGIFIIKNNDIGINFLNDCINTYTNRPQCINNNQEYILFGEWAGECYEQGIMNELINSKYSNDVYNIPEQYVKNQEKDPFAFNALIVHQFGDKNLCLKRFKEYLNNNKLLPIIPNKTPLKFCVLLTMYCSPEKYNTYYDIVIKWLNNTNLPIFVIDSYGNEPNLFNISSSKLQIHSFQQKNKEVILNPSVSEKESLLKALEFFDFSEYDIIFKVTGKYYSCMFEKFLQYIPTDAQIILQYNRITDRENSEIVGIKTTLFKQIIDKININTTFEKVLKNIKNLITYTLPPLSIDKKVNRYDVNIFNFL